MSCRRTAVPLAFMDLVIELAKGAKEVAQHAKGGTSQSDRRKFIGCTTAFLRLPAPSVIAVDKRKAPTGASRQCRDAMCFLRLRESPNFFYTSSPHKISPVRIAATYIPVMITPLD